eukprot:m.115569 g.115569  ORF g.115569 m.115569 type:complete len:251 (-) comp9481_c1_seq3:2667-3419(-)
MSARDAMAQRALNSSSPGPAQPSLSSGYALRNTTVTRSSSQSNSPANSPTIIRRTVDHAARLQEAERQESDSAAASQAKSAAAQQRERTASFRNRMQSWVADQKAELSALEANQKAHTSSRERQQVQAALAKRQLEEHRQQQQLAQQREKERLAEAKAKEEDLKRRAEIDSVLRRSSVGGSPDLRRRASSISARNSTLRNSFFAEPDADASTADSPASTSSAATAQATKPPSPGPGGKKSGRRRLPTPPK